MSYVAKVLRPDERVIIVGKLHWAIYLGGAVVAVVGIAIAVLIGHIIATVIGSFFILLGVTGMLRAWVDQVTTEIAVTNFRVIQKRGLIRRETSEMNMDKVESVLVDQSLLGRLMNYGSVSVRGTGSGTDQLDFIADPLNLRSAIVVR